jgi:hypothetical protein
MFAIRVFGIVVALFVALAAHAKLPVRNMTVELRLVSQGHLEGAARSGVFANSENGYVVRSVAPRDAEPSIQKIFVMNGEKAQIKLGLSSPMQWTKTALSQSASGAAGGASGVENAVTWMESSQGLSVQVRWPGGKQHAVVEVEVDGAGLDTAHAQQNLPSQARQRVATMVMTPLGEWATIAVTGRRTALEQQGVYATAPADGDQTRVMQIRVLAP